MRPRAFQRKTQEQSSSSVIRLRVVVFGFALILLAIAGRLFQLQVLEVKAYRVLASDQHEMEAALVPHRGTISVQDFKTGEAFPVARDADSWLVYAAPRDMADPLSHVAALSTLLSLPAEQVTEKLSATSSGYVVLSKDVPLETVDKLRELHLRGIGLSKGLKRVYPEKGLGGQWLGFVSLNEEQQRTGRYGVEGFNNELLAGESGHLIAERDAAGRRLTIGTMSLKEARDGSSLVLTLDRAIQFEACAKMKETVKRFEATNASVVILDPATGAILALCSWPDYDPTELKDLKDVSVLNEQNTFAAYEPGSVFKSFTLAAGLDTNTITPQSTYNDSGAESMDGFTIRNSDLKAHGIQTMTQVLEKSLNTGVIYAQRLLGRETFRAYVEKFGFGDRTSVGLPSESRGNTAALEKTGKIFSATASFGQGISVTPLQLAAGYAALANGGNLLQPFLLKDIVSPDGRHETTAPRVLHRVISERSSRLITGMLVDVVENGHGKRAGVEGYFVAGKTGTAQIPDSHSGGYLKNATIGTFAGYAPADHPAFVMVVKVDRPKNVEYAESSAAPVFGELAKFLLNRMNVPPERPIKAVTGE